MGLWLHPVAASAQVTVTGTVTSHGSPLPGVNVVEKGTDTGTATNAEGEFSLTVSSEDAVVVFTFIGFVSQEIPVKERTHLEVTLQEDCNIDFFDHQQIGLYASSGVINTPVGGTFEFSFPAFSNNTTLKTSATWQSDLDKNNFVNVHLDLDHIVASCNFQMDIRSHYRKLSFNDDIDVNAWSVETNLHFDPISVIAGYSHLDFTRITSAENLSASGPMLGLSKWIGAPFNMRVTGKSAIYKYKTEYQAEVAHDFKRIKTFVRFYKLDEFTEVTLGVGTSFTYWLKRQRRG